MAEVRNKDGVFIAVAALLFAVSSLVTAEWSRSMATMGTMAMPGGWTMSMSWMRMPGQTWIGAAASFLGMWVVMMVAMMMPSLVPMLNRYRYAVQRIGSMTLGWLTMLAGTGYLLIWAFWGLVLYPLGVALASLEMRLPALARGVPLGIAGIVLTAGALQFSDWKLHYLACCRQTQEPSCELRGNRSTALCHGLRIGFHCSLSCANLTALLFAGGVMNLGTMVLVAAAITAERIVPARGQVIPIRCAFLRW